MKIGPGPSLKRKGGLEGDKTISRLNDDFFIIPSGHPERFSHPMGLVRLKQEY